MIATPAQAGTRSLILRGRAVPVVGPSRHDPRLRVSAVVIALQILGQTVLGFKVSIAQIVVTIVVSALFETVVTIRRQRELVWPASAILTGSSVAFILRASGTRHGDWWSLHGIQWFLLAALLSLLSKYLIRPAGRHLFNPSNVGLVWCLLVIGPRRVFPQYLWWGALRAPVIAALVVIVLGGLWVMKPVRMVPMAASFLVTLAVIVAVFAASGRSFVAVWHSGPIHGLSYWADICLSPELLIFAFLMMSDPQTAPKAPIGRVIYGAGTALVASALLLFQPTEFGIKLAILSSLTLTCALVPLIEWAIRLRRLGRTSGALSTPVRIRPTKVMGAVLNPVLAAAIIVAVAAPVDTATLVHNRDVILIERGLTGTHNPQ